MAFPNLRVCCDLVKDDPIGKVNVAAKAVSKRKQRQLFLVCFQVVLNNQRTKPSCSHQHLSSTIFLVDMCRIYQPFQLMSRFRWKSVKALTACPLTCNYPIINLMRINLRQAQRSYTQMFSWSVELSLIVEMLYLGGLVLFVKIRWYQSIRFTELSSDAGCESTGNRNFSVDPFPCEWFHIHHFLINLAFLVGMYTWPISRHRPVPDWTQVVQWLPQVEEMPSLVLLETMGWWMQSVGPRGHGKASAARPKRNEKGLMYNAELWFEGFFGTLMCCLHLSTMISTNHAVCIHELETRNIVKYTGKLKILQLIVRLFTRRASTGILAHAARLLVSLWSSWLPFEKNWQLKHWRNRW